jgi:hypothetical protein
LHGSGKLNGLKGRDILQGFTKNNKGDNFIFWQGRNGG